MAMTERGLPLVPIFYTEDQVAAVLNLTVDSLRKSYLWKIGVDKTPYRVDLIRCVLVSIPEYQPNAYQDWRIPQYELERWLRFHRIYVYDPEAVSLDPEVMAEGFAPARVRPDLPSVTSLPPDEDTPDADLLAL